jgi:dipeptidase E
MRYYLSSFKLGSGSGLLASLYDDGRPVAYIANALDHVSDNVWLDEWMATDLGELSAAGVRAERLDLRAYFGADQKLERVLKSFCGVWLSGGNVFVLRQAMMLSGLDRYLHNHRDRSDFTYGGYSAGCCVLSPTLRPYARVDDPHVRPYAQAMETIWDGLGILDFAYMPHFQSNHSESNLIEGEIAFCIENKIPYRAFRDGEVLAIERGRQRVITAAAQETGAADGER